MQLKPITHEGIPAALQKAERYRLLNDSSAAESICLDILEIDPTNQQALISLLLSITDQFSEEVADGVRRARDVLPRLSERIPAGVLRRHHLRAARAGAAPSRRARVVRGRLGVVSRGDALVRDGGKDQTRRRRRSDPALEHVRAHAWQARARARAARVRAGVGRVIVIPSAARDLLLTTHSRSFATLTDDDMSLGMTTCRSG